MHERVLVTGAAGSLGSLLRQHLPGHGWSVRGLDVLLPAEGDEDVVRASVTDLEAVRAACGDVAAVVHLGGIPRPGRDWSEYLATNIDGTRTVLEAARSAGVARVVVASSNHAVGYTPKGEGLLSADTPIRPDSTYGVSKAAGEALAAFYADEYGMQIISLRIGSCFPRPTSSRELATWLSPMDFVRLVLASLTASWDGHLRVWGVSDNTRRWWSLTEAERIGYRSQDDAERYAAAVPAAGEERFVGGTRPPSSRPAGAAG
jgi:uronate dehydrogenase